jgi:MFS family permease
LPRTFSALRHRNYRLFFLGQMVSLVGTWVQTTALMWVAFELTHEAKWPPLVLAAQMLPAFFLGVWGGFLADRWPKRRLIFWTQAAYLLLALALAGLALAGVVQPWHLLVIGAANGVVNAVDLPARLSFVMDMVGRDDLVNAVALNSLLFNVARALGPAFAGPLLEVLSPGACFLVNGLSYVAVLAALAAMDVEGSAHPTGERSGWRSLLLGFGYLVARPRLALVVLLACVLSVFAWPFLSLLPALAHSPLHAGARGYSLMLSSTGCGALTAALLVATYGSLERRRLFLGAGLALTVVALAGLSLSDHLFPAVGWSALAGCGLILYMATAQAVVQLGAGDENRGRILGVWSMALGGSLPLGNLLAGLAADLWTTPLVLCLQGAACGAASLLLLVLLGWRTGGVGEALRDSHKSESRSASPAKEGDMKDIKEYP